MKKIRLTQEQVDLYVAAKAAMAELQNTVEKQAAAIKKVLLEGARCPNKGPYLLRCDIEMRLKPSWKDLALQAAIRLTKGNRALARKAIAAVVRAAPRTEIPKLTVHPNPDYRA